MSDSYYDDIATEIWTWCEKLIIDIFSKQNDPNILTLDDSNDLGYIKGFTLSECKDKFPVHSINILTIACEKLVHQDKISIDSTMRRMVGYVYNQKLVHSIILQNMSIKIKELENKQEQDFLSEEKEKQEKRKLKKEHEEILKKQKINVINKNGTILQETNINTKKSNTIQHKKSISLDNNNKILSYFVKLSKSDANNENICSSNTINKSVTESSFSDNNNKKISNNLEVGNENLHPYNSNTLLVSNMEENFRNNITINEIILTTTSTATTTTINNNHENDQINKCVNQPNKSSSLLDEEVLLDHVGKLLLQCFEKYGGEVTFQTLLLDALSYHWECKDPPSGQPCMRIGITSDELQFATQFFANSNRIMIDGDTLFDI